GSALAAAAFLIRQLGALLLAAALLSLALRRRPRLPADLRWLLAVVLPIVPAVLIGAAVTDQRGQVREDAVAWTVAFWLEQGPALYGLVLARLTAIVITLGLLTLPLSLGALIERRCLTFRRWQWTLAGGLILAL